jgi:hypothetical protein
MRNSVGLFVVLASAGLATDAFSQPATRQPLHVGLQRGPDAFVMLAGGAKPYRPTVNSPRQGSSPCTAHCGPRPTVEDHRYKPEVRDHRTAVAKQYRPTVPSKNFYCNGNPRCATGYKPPKPEVRDHRKPPVAVKGPF